MGMRFIICLEMKKIKKINDILDSYFRHQWECETWKEKKSSYFAKACTRSSKSQEILTSGTKNYKWPSNKSTTTKFDFL